MPIEFKPKSGSIIELWESFTEIWPDQKKLWQKFYQDPSIEERKPDKDIPLNLNTLLEGSYSSIAEINQAFDDVKKGLEAFYKKDYKEWRGWFADGEPIFYQSHYILLEFFRAQFIAQFGKKILCEDIQGEKKEEKYDYSDADSLGANKAITGYDAGVFVGRNQKMLSELSEQNQYKDKISALNKRINEFNIILAGRPIFLEQKINSTDINVQAQLLWEKEYALAMMHVLYIERKKIIKDRKELFKLIEADLDSSPAIKRKLPLLEMKDLPEVKKKELLIQPIIQEIADKKAYYLYFEQEYTNLKKYSEDIYHESADNSLVTKKKRYEEEQQKNLLDKKKDQEDFRSKFERVKLILDLKKIEQFPNIPEKDEYRKKIHSTEIPDLNKIKVRELNNIQRYAENIKKAYCRQVISMRRNYCHQDLTKDVAEVDSLGFEYSVVQGHLLSLNREGNDILTRIQKSPNPKARKIFDSKLKELFQKKATNFIEKDALKLARGRLLGKSWRQLFSEICDHPIAKALFWGLVFGGAAALAVTFAPVGIPLLSTLFYWSVGGGFAIGFGGSCLWQVCCCCGTDDATPDPVPYQRQSQANIIPALGGENKLTSSTHQSTQKQSIRPKGSGPQHHQRSTAKMSNQTNQTKSGVTDFGFYTETQEHSVSTPSDSSRALTFLRFND